MGAWPTRRSLHLSRFRMSRYTHILDQSSPVLFPLAVAHLQWWRWWRDAKVLGMTAEQFAPADSLFMPSKYAYG